VIPIQDVIPTRLVPVATYTLLALNIVGYLTEVQANGDASARTVGGLTVAALIDAVRATFLHAALLPFAINVLFLWLFGGTVEDQLGRLRFVALYLICGTAAVVLSRMVNPASPVPAIGGSLAIAAVMGAYFVLFPNAKVLILVPIPIALHEVPAAVVFTIWCAAQFLALAVILAQTGAPDATVGSALAAYVLAFAMGAAFCFALRRKERAHVEWWDPRD